MMMTTRSYALRVRIKYTEEELLLFIRLLYEHVNAGKQEAEKRPLTHQDFKLAHREKRLFNGKVMPDHSVFFHRLCGVGNACRMAGVPYKEYQTNYCY